MLVGQAQTSGEIKDKIELYRVRTVIHRISTNYSERDIGTAVLVEILLGPWIISGYV